MLQEGRIRFGISGVKLGESIQTVFIIWAGFIVLAAVCFSVEICTMSVKMIKIKKPRSD